MIFSNYQVGHLDDKNRFEPDIFAQEGDSGYVKGRKYGKNFNKLNEAAEAAKKTGSKYILNSRYSSDG